MFAWPGAKRLLFHGSVGALTAMIAYSFVGIGYAAGWLHFTAGPLRFGFTWKLPVIFAGLLLVSTLGSELLLRGLLLRKLLAKTRLSAALALSTLCTTLLAAPFVMRDEMGQPYVLELLSTATAWGLTLSILYAITRSVPACGVAAALYRLLSQYGVCDIELGCEPVGYFVTSLAGVRWMGAGFALLPGALGLVWLGRKAS